MDIMFMNPWPLSMFNRFWCPPKALPKSMVLKLIFWFCGKGFVNTLCDEFGGIFHTSAQVSEVIYPTNIAKEIDLTFRLLVPPPLLSFLSSLSFPFLFQPFRFFLPFFLFLLGCWLPFWFNDCIESTSSFLVGWDEAVGYPDACWLIENLFVWFVTKSVGLSLVRPTIPSVFGPGLNLGSKLDRGAFEIISYKIPDCALMKSNC